MMRTLFLQAPSFRGFDGGAGSRYQAKREIASFWYPTWLAQPAALVDGSKLIDAPPHKIGIDLVVKQARDYDLVVIHTSTPSFESDVRTIEAMKAANPGATRTDAGQDRGSCRRAGQARMPAGGYGLFQRGECRGLREGGNRTADRPPVSVTRCLLRRRRSMVMAKAEVDPVRHLLGTAGGWAATRRGMRSTSTSTRRRTTARRR